jgi:RND family efflux transporter MFP subunit
MGNDRDKKRSRLLAWLGRHRGLAIGTLISLAAIWVTMLIIQHVPQRTSRPGPSRREGIPVETALVRLEPTLADTFQLKGVVEPKRVVRPAAEVSARIDFLAPRKTDGIDQAVARRAEELAAKVVDPDQLPSLDDDIVDLLAAYAVAGDLAADGAEPIDEGDPVRQGQPLLYLNTDLLLARYHQARAQMEYDRRELAKYQRLEAQGGASPKDVEDRQLVYQTSRAALQSARANLVRSVVRSPIDGTLNRLLVESGEFVQPGQVVAEIVDDSELKVAVDVPEADIGYFELGQRHDVLEVAGREVGLAGTITYISKTAEGSARKTRIELTMGPEATERLHAGNIVTVRLKRRDLRNVIMAPLQAVIPGANEKMVYVAADGQAQRRVVELDLRTVRGTDVRVRRGLTPGDRLIVKGHRQCGDGQEIREVPLEVTLDSLVEYEVSGQVDAAQLADVMRRLGQNFEGVDGVAAVDVLAPGDRIVPVTFDGDKAAAVGLAGPKFAEKLGLGKLDLSGEADWSLPARVILRADGGYDHMPLAHRVLTQTEEGEPVFLWQVASSVGDGVTMPAAAPRLVVSAYLAGASIERIQRDVAEPIAAALKAAGAVDVRRRVSPDLAGLSATFAHGEDPQRVLAKVRQALQLMAEAGSLPEGLEGPIVAGRPGLPRRRIVVATWPGIDETRLAGAIDETLKAFRKDKAELTEGLDFARRKGPAVSDEPTVAVRPGQAEAEDAAD